MNQLWPKVQLTTQSFLYLRTQVKTRLELVAGPGLMPLCSEMCHYVNMHNTACTNIWYVCTCIETDDTHTLKAVSLPPTPGHHPYSYVSVPSPHLLAVSHRHSGTRDFNRTKKYSREHHKGETVAVTRCTVLYLSNSTLAWQGWPGQGC